MKHTYPIQGMTCNGCRTHVEEALANVEGVKRAEVDLERAEATIEMESHVPIENLQEALGQNGWLYIIHPPGGHHDHDHHDHDHHDHDDHAHQDHDHHHSHPQK